MEDTLCMGNSKCGVAWLLIHLGMTSNRRATAELDEDEFEM